MQENENSALDFSLSDSDEEQQGISFDLKPYLKYIVIAIIIIFIVYFLFDFFIFSNKKIVFSVKDLEGNQVNGTSIKIFNENNELIANDSSRKLYFFTLRKGNYLVKVSASGFKAFSKLITVKEEQEFELKLEKDLRVNIVGIDLPEKLYSGQKTTAVIHLKNNSDKKQQVQLISSKSDILISPKNDLINLASNESKEEILNIEVKKNLNIPKDGLNLKASIRIMFTNENKEFTLKVLRMPRISVPKTLSFDNIDLTKEQVIEKKITIENKSNNKIDNLNLELLVTEATANNLSDAEKWLKFNSNNSSLLTISLNEKEKKSIKIKLNLPISTKKDNIKAVLSVNSDFLTKPILSNISINITNEATAKLLIELVPRNEAFIEFNNETQEYNESSDYYLSLSNKGTIAFERIAIVLINFDECNEDFLSVEGNKIISELKPGTEAKLNFILKMPSNAVNQQEQDCNFSVIYRNPITKERKIDNLTLKLIASKPTVVE